MVSENPRPVRMKKTRGSVVEAMGLEREISCRSATRSTITGDRMQVVNSMRMSVA